MIVPARLIRTAADRTAIARGCWFDQGAADKVRAFCRKFVRLDAGPGKPGKPFDPFPWQWEGIIEPLFGWKKPNGKRRFARAYLSTPKKNGKSVLLAALTTYLLVGDGEPSCEVYSAASDREQAGIIFREAEKMIKKSPALQSEIRIKASTKMLYGPNGAFYRALSSESTSGEGVNAHGLLFDELHAQPDRLLWDCLEFSGAHRTQSLHISITTAGGDLETICGEQYRYACSIRDGHNTEDTQFFQAIWEADTKDDWGSEATWKKANPSLGIPGGLDIEKFRADFLQARESPAKENPFRRYRLNQWTQTASAWLSMDLWDKGSATAEDLAGRECFAGLDLSATDDTTALILLFPSEDGSCDLLPYFWLPEDNIVNLERRHRVPYRAWVKSGHFELTPGNVVDYRVIRSRIKELAVQFSIKEIAIDRKFQGQSVETDLADDGLEVRPAGQGWVSQDLPAKELEKLLKAGRVRHGGHPVLRWHASNVVVDIDKNGNYTINKRKSRSKIDGIAALLMALMGRMQSRESETCFADDVPQLLLL